ncbi:hypothetical protein NX021_14680 [Cytobacillus firmus]|nr:hypothetical protein [Cytobacillus firmus]
MVIIRTEEAEVWRYKSEVGTHSDRRRRISGGTSPKLVSIRTREADIHWRGVKSSNNSSYTAKGLSVLMNF